MSPAGLMAARLATWAGVLAALAGAFALYLRPEFIVSLADRVWSCF